MASALLSGPGAPDMLAVDAVGGLSLVARRAGGTVSVSEACRAMRDLLELAGLPVEVEGHPEEGEDGLEVE